MQGWRHKPVQLTKSFVPRRGRERGTPVFYGGEVLSFHSQSFKSVSETKERKRTTNNKHATYENLAGRPRHSPGMRCRFFSLDFFFPSLFPPLLAAATSIHPSTPITVSLPGHRTGLALLHPTRTWDAWHGDGSQGPFLSSGAVPAPPRPAASSLNPLCPPIPGSSTPQTTPALLQRLALHLHPAGTRHPASPGSPSPRHPPVTLLRATAAKPHLCPSASLLCPRDALPGLCPLQPLPWD